MRTFSIQKVNAVVCSCCMPADVARALLPAHIAAVGLGACYERGVAGVGMEEIAARAQVSKRTLYRHFRGKLEILERGLSDRSALWLDLLARESHPVAANPREAVLALFDALVSGARTQPYLGCAFVNATAQTAASTSRLGDLARLHKARLLTVMTEAVAASGAANPDLLARQIMLVVEGALASAVVAGDICPVALARDLVDDLMDRQLSSEEAT